MRIGMLTQWYDPEPGPAALPGALARGLLARGHEVQVVTGFPNYPTGKLADGYRQSRRLDEIIDGVRVRRVALYANHAASVSKRIANYGSFALSARVSGIDAFDDIDALWVNYSPVTIGWPMFAQQRRHKTPTVVHALDLWPDTLFASGFGGQGRVAAGVHGALDRWCHRMYAKAQTVAFISPGVGEVLASRGVPRHKLAYAPMWADETVNRPYPAPADRSRWGVGPDEIALVYAGTLGNAQDLSTLVAAVVGASGGVRCLIAGSGIEETRLRDLARPAGDRIRFLGRLEREDMAELMAASDIHYIGLNAHPLARTTMPSKVQSILASGRVAIGSLEGDAAGVVVRAGGWVVSPGDISGLTAAINEAASLGRASLISRGTGARELYDADFSYQRGVERIEMLLEAARNRT